MNSFKVLAVPSWVFSRDTEQNIREDIWKVFPGAQVHIELVDKKIEREKSGKFRAFKSMVGKIH